MVRPPKGPQRGTAALLSGCVMDPWFGAVHDATIDLLAAAGYAVTVPEGQTCCGALAAHDGAAEAAHRLAEQNVNAFKGFDVVVVNSAGCGAHLKQYGHWASTAGAELGDRVRDVTEVVADSIDAGLLPDLDTGRGSVAVQDPCHLRHAQRMTSQPRRVLQAAGYDLIELSDDGLCCGAAGVYSVLRPDTSAELGRRKTAEILATGSTVVATANPGCEIQLRSHLPRWPRSVTRSSSITELSSSRSRTEGQSQVLEAGRLNWQPTEATGCPPTRTHRPGRANRPLWPPHLR